MRQIFINSTQSRDWDFREKSRAQTHYDRLSIICFGGGMLGMLIGLVLLVFFDASDKASAILKYRALIVIFSAALMLGFSAHFMDRSDDERRIISKLRSSSKTEEGSIKQG